MRTSTSSPRPGPALESILLIGELFTDEHLTEMITHPLISLGVDGFTSAVDSDARRGHRASRLLRRARALPDAARRRAASRCRSRRRSAR